MPVYKLSKALSVINTHAKGVNDRYWKTHTFSAFVAPKTVLWSGNTAFIPTSNGVGQAVTLNQPISKLRNGLVINFAGFSGPSWSRGHLSTNTVQVPKNWTGSYKVVWGVNFWSDQNVFVVKIDDTHIRFDSDESFNTGGRGQVEAGGQYSTLVGYTNMNNGGGVQYAIVKDIEAY